MGFYIKTYVFGPRRIHCVGLCAAGGQDSKTAVHIRPSVFG